MYCFGIETTNSLPSLCVYKLTKQLQKTDSLKVALGTTDAGNFLEINADTLHNYLNIYVQKKEGKSIHLFRFDSQLKMVVNIKEVEVARLNNLSLFDEEPFYFENKVLVVKTISDSSGKQFYLNKFSLKSDSLNFDYKQDWQFAFERKNIRSVKILSVDTACIYLFVDVFGGNHTGQWLLKLDAKQGKLVKGSRVSESLSTYHYYYGVHRFQKNDKSIQLFGMKTILKDVGAGNLLSLPAGSMLSLYYIKMDSLLELENRVEFKVPVMEGALGAKKSSFAYLLKPFHIKNNPDGSLRIECDIYKSLPLQACFKYVNSQIFTVVFNEAEPQLEKTNISTNLLIEGYYNSSDKLDMNGKLCSETGKSMDYVLYHQPNFPVKIHFKSDEVKNSSWLLQKIQTKTNTLNLSVLQPVKGIYQIKSLEELSKSLNPKFIKLSNNLVLISTQTRSAVFNLKLISW